MVYLEIHLKTSGEDGKMMSQGKNNLFGILGDSFNEPDLAFPYLVNTYLPVGLKGIVLCGLFASLMSTIDSTFNSLATLWSIDIYSKYFNKNATDSEKINSGRKAIIFSFFTAILM